MLELYGIENCDTCRKARRWLDNQGVDYQYIDLRDDGIERTRLQRWLDTHGNKLINKRSRTWRGLDAGARDACDNAPLTFLLEQPTLIKRPVLETPDSCVVGFLPADYEAALAASE